MNKQEDKSPYISVYHPICGHKAIMYAWYDDEHGGMWDVAETGMCGYHTQREAIIEAIDWAKAEGVRYEGPELEPPPEVNVVFFNGEHYVHCGGKAGKRRLINTNGKALLVAEPSQPFTVVKKLTPKFINNYWYFNTKLGVFSTHNGTKVKSEKILSHFK